MAYLSLGWRPCKFCVSRRIRYVACSEFHTYKRLIALDIFLQYFIGANSLLTGGRGAMCNLHVVWCTLYLTLLVCIWHTVFGMVYKWERLQYIHYVAHYVRHRSRLQVLLISIIAYYFCSPSTSARDPSEFHVFLPPSCNKRYQKKYSTNSKKRHWRAVGGRSSEDIFFRKYIIYTFNSICIW